MHGRQTRQVGLPRSDDTASGDGAEPLDISQPYARSMLIAVDEHDALNLKRSTNCPKSIQAGPAPSALEIADQSLRHACQLGKFGLAYGDQASCPAALRG